MHSDAQQELTAPTETTLFQTPAMGFGEIGFTGEQQLTGYDATAHSVGEFDDTVLLERMIVVGEYPWAVTDPLGSLFAVDIDKELREHIRNNEVMKQFLFYRSDIEVTVRLVTNQFYYGALMITLFPTDTIGESLDARAVLDPTVLSATSDQAVVKEWKYSWPYAWLDVAGSLHPHPVWLHGDVLCPLKAAKDTMPSAINVQVWARFKNMRLAYPYIQPALEAQSSGKPLIKFPRKKTSAHPIDDKDAESRGSSTVDTAIEAVKSVTIGDAVSAVSQIPSFVVDNWGGIAAAAGFLFDKPDRIVCQDAFNLEPSQDLFLTDVPDTNVSLSVYKGRYCDPGDGRMPMSRNFTVSDYARIPGLRGPPLVFAAQFDSAEVDLFQPRDVSTKWGTPFDYAMLSSCMWRGGVKVLLQFFASSFISTRISVQVSGAYNRGNYPGDYSSGISKIINVKGDVEDTFVVPWLSDQWWGSIPFSRPAIPQLKITVVAPIISTDTTLDPVIYCVPWIAGAEDIQFAFPTVPDYPSWVPSTLGTLEPQSAPGEIFKKTFPPIIPNCHYDIDRGYATAEMLGPIVDLCKRYSPIAVTTFQGIDLDTNTLDFRRTLFGSWRAAFLNRSGGFRFRVYGSAHNSDPLAFVPSSSLGGTEYRQPPDGMCRLTIPQVALLPFQIQDQGTQILSVIKIRGLDTGAIPYIAARDDLQLGFPVLPRGIPPLPPAPSTFSLEVGETKEKGLDEPWVKLNSVPPNQETVKL